MRARLIFLGITLFWLTMNVLLWRVEFGARGGDTPVPVQLVWRKILTAPDASSLSVYQKGERTGYCEFATGVGQQMASFDEGKPPPDGFVSHPGYLLHVAGNISLGDFTNRLKFDSVLRLDKLRQWTSLSLRITSRSAVMEIHGSVTNQSAHVKLTNEGATLFERDVAFSELQDPAAMMRTMTGGLTSGFFGVFDLPGMLPGVSQEIQWDARRTRVKIGAEAVPVYELETTLLGRLIIVDVSTLGEVMRIELPGEITARIDEWSKP